MERISGKKSLDANGAGGIRVVPVPIQDLPVVWPAAVPFLNPVMEYTNGRLTIKAVADALLSRDMQLWAIVSEKDTLMAALVSEIVIYPTGLRTVRIILGGGSGAKKWIGPGFETIGDWAKTDRGCSLMEITGRPGWGRLLKHLGFTKALFTLDAPLTGE